MKKKQMPNPTSHPNEMGRVSTMELILSVIESYVCPGPSTGVSRRSSGELIGGSLALMPSPVQDSDYERPQGT